MFVCGDVHTAYDPVYIEYASGEADWGPSQGLERNSLFAVYSFVVFLSFKTAHTTYSETFFLSG